MDAIECMKNRRSIRRFKRRPINRDQLVTILTAGNNAPCPGNLHTWRFFVIDDAGKKADLAEATLQPDVVNQAPVAIIVCNDSGMAERQMGERGGFYITQGTAAAVQNMLLAATSLGLGSLWLGSFEEDKVHRTFEIPDSMTVHAIVLVGYANESPKARKLHVAELTYFNDWENKHALKEFWPISKHLDKIKSKFKRK